MERLELVTEGREVGLSWRQLWGLGLLLALSKVGGTEICQAHVIAQRCIIGGESHHLGNSRKSRHRRWRRRAPGPQLLEAALSASARARGESGPARLSFPPWAVFPPPLGLSDTPACSWKWLRTKARATAGHRVQNFSKCRPTLSPDRSAQASERTVGCTFPRPSSCPSMETSQEDIQRVQQRVCAS